MKKDRLYDILETMKKDQLKAALSHFGAPSDHSALGTQQKQQTEARIPAPSLESFITSFITFEVKFEILK